MNDENIIRDFDDLWDSDFEDVGDELTLESEQNDEKRHEETIEENIEEQDDLEYVEEDTECADEENIHAFILIDRELHGLINYFRESGVNISNIFTGIKEIRDLLLIQTDACRVIIIDSGTGRFTSTKMRKEIIDTLGICDENTRISVFYTDSALKVDATLQLGLEVQSVDWYKYNGTPSVIANILMYKEKYKLSDISGKNDVIEANDALMFKGNKANISEGDRLDLGDYHTDIIDKMKQDKKNILPAFNIKI